MNMTSIIITVGNKFFDQGQTTVTISTDGVVHASNEYNKECVYCEIKITKEELSVFLESLSTISLTKIKQRKGDPDEAKYIIEIKKQKKTQIIEVWDNDLRKFEKFRTSLLALRRLIYKQSGQRILL